MKIKKDELGKILDKLKPVSLKDDILVENFLGQLIFSEEGIAIFNDQTYIYHPIETGLDCVVSYSKLKSFINKTLGEYIKINNEQEEDMNKVLVTCGKARMTLNSLMLNDIDKGTIDKINKTFEGKISDVIPDNFSKAIKSCSFSASTDPADGQLSCICIFKDKVIAADRARVGVYTLTKPFSESDNSILINSNITSTLVKFDARKFKLDVAWVIFKDEEGCLLAVRRIRGKYPYQKLMSIFNSFNKGRKIKLPDETDRIIDLVTTLISDISYVDRNVTISIEDNTFKLSAQSESALIEEKINFNYKGHPFSFSINPSALQQALSVVKIFELLKNKENTMVYMQAENFEHIIALRVTK